MSPSLTATLQRAAILVSFALGSGLATAGTQAPVASRVVSYADLNLARAHDVATLYRRINRAADAVCDPAEPLGHNECVAHAVAEAVREARRPELAAFLEQEKRLRWPPRTSTARR